MSKAPPSPKSSTAACDVWSLVQKDYRVGDVLNTGRDGTVVRKGVHRTTSDVVALKSIPITSKSRRDTIRREAQLMQCLDHPNILQCHEIFEGPYEAVLVLEFCAGGDLLDYVNSRGPSNEDDARKMFIQVLDALLESHTFGIAHRDIKLENVLIRADGSLVLGDYGLAKTYAPGEQFTLPCGTLTYAGPELHEPLSKMRVDPEAADVFALGVLLFAVVTARLPYQGATDEEVVASIRSGTYDMPSRLSQPLRDLLKSMLAVDPKQRPSLAAILNHIWTNPNQKPLVSTKPTRSQSLSAIRVSSNSAVSTNKTVTSSAVAVSNNSSTNSSKDTTTSPRKNRNSMFVTFCKNVASSLSPSGKLTNLLIH